MVWRCGAVYHGRRAVQGTQSQSTLTAIVDTIVREDGDPTQLHSFTKGVGKGERCQVVVEEERFVVVGGSIPRGPGTGRDEGFESDSESSAGSNNCDDHCCATHDIKVISDHVLRLDALLQQQEAQGDSGSAGFASASSSSSSSDDASSATSSGAESEDDTPRHHNQASSTRACCTGGSNVPGDVFLLSDILFCHVDAATPRIVVLVVKDAGSSLIHAHVYETSSDEQARTLYQHYKEASNKYKLNRYRNSKRKLDTPKNLSESSDTSSISKNSVFTGKHSSSSLGVLDGKNFVNASNINSVSDSDRKVSTSSTDSGISRGFDGPGRASVRSVEARLKAQGKNNVNVIEIRETISPLEEGEVRAEGGSKTNWNLLQHIDVNGVTHIEIESGPCSVASNNSSKSGEATTSSEYSSLVSLSAPESCPEQISGAQSLPARPSSRADNLNAGGSLRGSSGLPSSLSQPPIKEVLVGGEKDKKFRQRQPARLLRTDENGLQSTAGIVIGGKLIGGGQDTRKLENKRHDERKEENQERKKRDDRRGDDRESRSRRDRHEDRSIVRDTHRSSTVDPYLPRPERQSRPRDQSRGRARHTKGPAPPPPPRRHPSNPSLMLVPTKSGAENARAFYPKESHIVRGNKIVRVEFPGYHGWGIHHDGSSSPHAQQRYAYYHPGSTTQAWIGPHEYHAASRPRDSAITPEMRRRSRSKSPARKPMAHRYIDAMSNLNISQRLKDIKDAVVTRAQNGPNMAVNNLPTGETRGHQRTASTVSAPPDVNSSDTESGLKPVIKKGRRPVTDTNRRVTFSAYATVQVMDV